MKTLLAAAALVAVPLAADAQALPESGDVGTGSISSVELNFNLSGFGGRTFFLQEKLQDAYRFPHLTATTFGGNIFKEHVGFGFELSGKSALFIPDHYTTNDHYVDKQSFHEIYSVGLNVGYKDSFSMLEGREADYSLALAAYYGYSWFSENYEKTDRLTGEVTQEVDNETHKFMGLGLESAIQPLKLHFGDVSAGLGLRLGVYYNALNFGDPHVKRLGYSVTISLSEIYH